MLVIKSKRTGCSCKKCQECCRREPGWFVPEEVPIAAMFLNFTESDFISRFCEEHAEDGALAISPARKPEKTECVFLNQKGLCDIHPVKPYECRKVFGCDTASRHKRIREMIKRRWR
ncbi:MAG: YkgJ family cysteine cluster protein [Pseudomonadota bacterium]